MNEDELTRQLHSAAAVVEASPNLAEIETTAGRMRGRRRVATGVIAAMLVAGAGGAGFGLGRSVTDDSATIVAGDAPEVAASDTREVVPPRPTLPRPPAPEASPPSVAADEPAAEVVAAEDVFAGDSGYGYYSPAALELVYVRQIGDLRVRVLRGEPWDEGEPWSEDGWTPAKFCWPTAESRITIDGPDLVDVSGFGWFEELFGGLQVSPVEAGWSDGRPLRILQIQTTPDVSAATVVWDDGLTDTTEIVDGVGVLLVDGELVWEHDYTLDVTDASGTRSLTKSDLEYYDDPDYRAGCNPPPPSLPAAGEQPADPAAAEAALLERWNLLWDGLVSSDDKPDDLLDDNTGIDAATEAVYAGSFAESAESAEHVIEELVFTAPTEAWFRYGIDTINGYFGERYGIATLTETGWQFRRDMVCNDLALAGGHCEPGFEPIYPDSWYERYEAPYEECWIDEAGTEVCEVYDEVAPPPQPTLVPIPTTVPPDEG